MIDPTNFIAFHWPLAQAAVDPANLPRIPGTYYDQHYSNVMLVSIGLGAVAYWLLQRGVIKNRGLVFAGVALFAVAAVLAFASVPMRDSEAVVRFCFSVIAVAGGFGFIVAREPVHAALGFATAVLSTCGILFMQGALFISAATMIVYAGATIIIFLFVLMFAHQTNLRAYEVRLTHPAFATLIATSLVVAITLSVADDGEILPLKVDLTRPHSLSLATTSAGEIPPVSGEAPGERQEVLQAPSKTSGLGRAMYTDYLLAIELAGTILLVATIGAIALAQKPGEDKS